MWVSEALTTKVLGLRDALEAIFRDDVVHRSERLAAIKVTTQDVTTPAAMTRFRGTEVKARADDIREQINKNVLESVNNCGTADVCALHIQAVCSLMCNAHNVATVLGVQRLLACLIALLVFDLSNDQR